MRAYVTKGGSDYQELIDTLLDERVVFQMCQKESVRELETGSWEVVEVQANLPEVKIPKELDEGVIGAQAWRLPSGQLIITDMQGSLIKISRPAP
ncbi:MAG: hypothetical protein ACLFUU_06930 [Desulfobacteraceae bacterium]